MASFCSKCGVTLPPESHFCNGCGAPVMAVADHVSPAAITGPGPPLQAELIAAAATEKSTRTKQILAIFGALLLFVGVFLPIVSMPIVGSLNYFHNGQGDGTIVLALAVISIILAITQRFRGLWITGLCSLGLLLFALLNFLIRMSQLRDQMQTELADNPFKGLADVAMNSVQFQWGWAVLMLGAVLIVVAAAMRGPAPAAYHQVVAARRAVRWSKADIILVVFGVAALILFVFAAREYGTGSPTATTAESAQATPDSSTAEPAQPAPAPTAQTPPPQPAPDDSALEAAQSALRSAPPLSGNSIFDAGQIIKTVSLPDGNKVNTTSNGQVWIILGAGWKGRLQTGEPLNEFLSFEVQGNMPYSSNFSTAILTRLPESDIVGAPSLELTEIQADCASRTYQNWAAMPLTEQGTVIPPGAGPEGVMRRVEEGTQIWYVFDMLCKTPAPDNHAAQFGISNLPPKSAQTTPSVPAANALASENAIPSNESVTPQPEAQKSAPPQATPATAAMQPFTSAAGRFSVLFPATPKQSSRQIDFFGNGETATLYVFVAVADSGTTGYSVQYTDFAPDDLKGVSPQAFLQRVENNFVADKNLLTDSVVDLHGVPSHGYTAADSEYNYTVHDFVAGTRFYRLLVTTRKGYTATQADQFMNSFRPAVTPPPDQLGPAGAKSGNPPTDAVAEGQTVAEVVAILGPPTSITTGPVDVYNYAHLSILFARGKVWRIDRFQ